MLQQRRILIHALLDDASRFVFALEARRDRRVRGMGRARAACTSGAPYELAVLEPLASARGQSLADLLLTSANGPSLNAPGTRATVGAMRGKVGGRGLVSSAPDDEQAARAPAIGKRTLVGAESPGPLIQRKEDHAAAASGASDTTGADGAAGGPPATGLLVDDHVAAGPQQMRRADFLAKVERAIKAAVSAELGPPWNVADCPYIEKYLGIYRERPAAVVEQFVRRYTGSTVGEPLALVVALSDRVRRGVQQWKETGKLPADVAAADPRTAAAVEAPAPAMQRKPTPGAPGAAEGAGRGGSPTDVLASLGEGRPLEGGTAARMGRAFDTSFADVRIHDDETGGAVAKQQDALAFTVGKHVAFAPGKYNPGSPEGDALLAHELTHVMQQRGESSGGGATAATGASGAEADADRAATAAIKHLHAGSAEKAAPRASSDFQLQRCAGNPAETGLVTTDLKGQFLDRKVGSTSATASSGIPYTLTTDIRAARTLGAFDTEAAALAAVKTNGKAGAVTVENAKYIAYETDIGFGYRERTHAVIGIASGGSTTSYAPKLAPGVIALVSNEMMTVRAGQFDPGAEADAQGSADKQLSSAGSPFVGYQQALGGEQGDLNTLSDDKLIAAFHAAMKDTALVVLNRSAEQVKAKQSRFDKGGAGLSDTELEAMKATAQELAADDGKIAGVKKTLGDLNLKKAMASGPAGGYVSTLYDKDIAAAQANLAQLETQRRIHLAKYPLLSRVEPAEFLKLTTKEEMAGKLGGELPGILKDIETTKQNIADGKVNLWAVDQVVDATIAGFGLDEAKRKVITDTRASEAKKTTIESVVFTVFAIGFGLAAAFVSGGAGLFFAAGAFGLSTYDAMKQTEQYMVDKPASNVALDKDGGFAAPPGWGWLVVAWIGVGLDAAQVASAVSKVAKAEVTVADAAKELAADARRLGMTEEELLTKLRSLAGDIDGAAKVTEGAKGALAGKLGLPVDIDPKLAGDVRVFYEVDKATGRVTVKSLVAGPEATMAEVLAHERLIQHMRRYEGVTGRLRELWEQLLAFAGKSPTDKNPFPAGSKAWESWNELYKLPDVVDAQFLKYRDGLRAGNETTLVKDLEILEDQARRHRSIIDEMVGEAGAGFVAKTGDSTRAAIAAGYPLPAGVSTAEDLLAKGYYYRAGANGKYDLVRKTSAGVDQLRVEFDAAGKPVRLVKATTAATEPTDPAAWIAKLEEGLSPDELAKLDKMKKGKTPAEQRAMFDGDLDSSREKVRAQLRAEQGAAATKAQSRVRADELKQEIANKGLMNDPEIRAIVDDVSKKPKDKLPTLRDKLMAKILKMEVQAANPGAEVIDGVKVYEKMPEATLDVWKVKHPGEKIDGLTPRPDGLYMQRGEVDMMVVERDPAGRKAKIISREEIKTGVLDTSAGAKSQLDAQSTLFRDGASGAKKLRLEVGGRDIAGELDLATDAGATKTTRGPAGKGFDKSLGVTAGDLENLCKDLLKSSSAPGSSP